MDVIRHTSAVFLLLKCTYTLQLTSSSASVSVVLGTTLNFRTTISFMLVHNPEKTHTLIGCQLVQLFTMWAAHPGCSRQHYNFELFCSQIKLETSYRTENTLIEKNIKPWSNGIASQHKFCTCVSFGHPLASTCVDFGQAQIWTQVDASFLPFGHPAHIDTSWLQVICCYKNALTNDMHEVHDFFVTCEPTCKMTCESVWPPLQVRTQVLVL